MKRTNPAIELAAVASSTRPCALPGDMAAPGAPTAIRFIDNSKKRNGFTDTGMGVTARRQRSFPT
jgi:hypothetical protein